MSTPSPSNDPFVPGERFRLEPSSVGPLSGLTLAVKDIFDVAGRRTGAGNPDWLAAQSPATNHAWAVERLSRAGATIVGKTVTDEFAFSIMGENHHYGTPLNPAAPQRIPGGSSSGSASAVAQGLADIGLGSDTGGSVRVPAAFCGLFGIRTTHGAIPRDGVFPLAQSFDTVGWFARTADLLSLAGDQLLPPDASAPPLENLLVAENLFALAPSQARSALEPVFGVLSDLFAHSNPITVETDLLDLGREAFRLVQGREIARNHGAWVRSTHPAFGQDIAERLAWVQTLTDRDEARGQELWREFLGHTPFAENPTAVLCLPTTLGPAPLKGASPDEKNAGRIAYLRLTCLAGLLGAPQAHIPCASLEGAPFGLSLVAAPGRDRALLSAVRAVSQAGGYAGYRAKEACSA